MLKFLTLFTILAFGCLDLKVVAQHPITYLSYNILEGFKNDPATKSTFIEWVKDKKPDIVAFQETNQFTQKSLEQFALAYGHPYAILSKETGYPVSLTSKYPIVNVQKVLDNMWHGYIYAQILDYHVFVLHLSPHVQQKRYYEIQQIIAHAKTLPANAKVILSGDFNAVSEVNAMHYPEELRQAMVESEAKQSNIRNLKDGKIDYSIMKAMQQAGYVDAFHSIHQKFKASIPTKTYGSPTSFPRRIDFIMVSPTLRNRIVEVDIIHDEVTDRISDHYPVIMKLK